MSSIGTEHWPIQIPNIMQLPYNLVIHSLIFWILILGLECHCPTTVMMFNWLRQDGAQFSSKIVDDVAGLQGHNSDSSRQIKMNEPPINLFKVTYNLFEDFTDTLSKGTYQILVGRGFEHCRQQLPWWQDYQGNSLLSTVYDSSKITDSEPLV